MSNTTSVSSRPRYELGRLHWFKILPMPMLGPRLQEHFGLISTQFTSDLLASIIIFLIAVPLSVGHAIVSGVPPALGIVTAMIGGLVVGAIAGSPLLVSGPAASFAMIIWEVVHAHGLAALGPIVLLAGVIQMIAGGCRMAMWFRAVPPSVIHGMLAGIGISIVANQLYVMMDQGSHGSGLKNLMLFPGELEHLFEAVWVLPVEQWLGPIDGSTHHLALGIGALSIVVILLWSKLAPRRLRVVPAFLVAVTLASAVTWLLQLSIRYVSVPSNLLDDVHFISWGSFGEIFHDRQLFSAALAIAFIASAETLLSAVAVDKMHDGVRTKYHQELFAQGVGNSLCGLLGALPMTGLIARSGANVSAGAKTRASAFLHGLWLLIFVSFFFFILASIPMAALAAVLVFVGVKLIGPDHIHHLRQYGKGEVCIYWITLVTIVATDLLNGVLIGIGFAFAKLIYVFLHLETSLAVEEHGERATLKLRGAATFIQLPKLAKTLEEIPPNAELHVDIHELNYVDHACLDLLETWEEQHKATGGRLIIEREALISRCHRRPVISNSGAAPALKCPATEKPARSKRRPPAALFAMSRRRWSLLVTRTGVDGAGIVANGGVCTVAYQHREIITGVGRRRSWSSEGKVRLVGEVAERGVAEVARRHEVCRSLLYRWRRQMRRGNLAAVPLVGETKDEPPAAPTPPQNTLGSETSLGLVEIVLGNGRVLRAAERIDPAVLARLAAALDRR
jgi:MFS superfamily sulfate permease-like transporter/transposase-like protein